MNEVMVSAPIYAAHGSGMYYRITENFGTAGAYTDGMVVIDEDFGDEIFRHSTFEDGEQQLLAILAHEYGHLEQDVIWWKTYGVMAGFWLGGVLGLTTKGKKGILVGLLVANYTPAYCKMITSWLTEWDADRRATKRGYGEGLLRFFQVSVDHKIINPEFTLEHPSVESRVKMIKFWMKRYSK